MKTNKPIKYRLGWICLGVLLFTVFCSGATAQDGSQDVIYEFRYVDDDDPGDPGPGDPNVSDPNEDGSEEHPFDSVLEAIEQPVVRGGPYLEVTIVVAPGTYQARSEEEELSLASYPIISLVSSDPNDFSVVERTILDYPISLADGGTLAGFSMRGRYFTGISGLGDDMSTIRNCIILGNMACDGVVLDNFGGLLKNCLIADNLTSEGCGQRYAIYNFFGTMENCTIAGHALGVLIGVPGRRSAPDYIRIRNSIVYGSGHDATAIALSQSIVTKSLTTIEFSNIQGGYHALVANSYNPYAGSIEEIEEGIVWGEGNLDSDPRFACPGSWQYLEIDGDYYRQYVPGDYHLKSRGWRWTQRLVRDSHWIYDTHTSPCIDAGDPESDLGLEPTVVPPDAEGRYGTNLAINMGVYGGTSEASLAPVTPDEDELENPYPLWPVSPIVRE